MSAGVAPAKGEAFVFLAVRAFVHERRAGRDGSKGRGGKGRAAVGDWSMNGNCSSKIAMDIFVFPCEYRLKVTGGGLLPVQQHARRQTRWSTREKQDNAYHMYEYDRGY